MKSACANIIQILGRQWESLAYAGPNTVYPATLVFGVVGNTQLTAFAASYTLSVPLKLPRQNLGVLQVPDNSSSYPSV
jgi:hypothetical protein